MNEHRVEPESVGMSSSRLERIDPAMRAFVESGEIAGIATLVARRGKIVHRSRCGFRDREAGVAMTDDTIFRIYSMTKPIVSTALMLLYEEGRFQLEQPVAAFVPAFGDVKVAGPDGSLVDPARPPTIGDLLAHTSGLTYDFMIDNPVAELYREHRIMNDATRTLGEVVDAITELPLAFHPGERWHYSVGIDVAAHLIEILADQPLGHVLAERLFAPLGMTDTAFGVASGAEDRLAAMYGLPDLVGEGYHGGELMEAAMAGFNERLDVSDTYPTDAPDVFVRGGLGLFSTIDDYARFAMMLAAGGQLDGERVVGRKTLELMHTNRVPETMLPYEILGLVQSGFGFGLGSRVMLDVGANAGPGSVGEFGWAGAAKTYFWVDPVEDLVGVMMSQYMTGMQTPDRTFRSVVYQALTD
ncbi:MAG TPA: serine hydrolase domain-containing protein [Ilumatobacter sp.]|nr:serine hydrolase domain-containing protein [Ilumatobacter sp.]